jgi:heat shock protein HslJ
MVSTLRIEEIMCQKPLFPQPLLASLMLAALVVTACTRSEPTPTPPPAVRATQAVTNLSLVNSSWQVESFGGPDDQLDVLPDTQLTVHLGVERYAGDGGCNWFLGVYELDGSSLRFMTPAMSDAICDELPGVTEQEATYISTLENITDYRMDGDKLLGYTVEDQLMVTFAPAAPIPLEGQTWLLRMIESNDMMLAPIPDTEVTIVFEAGQLSGFGGCNTFEASYTLNDTSFTVSDLTSGSNECNEPDGVQQQEELVLDYLGSATQLVHVSGAVLFLDEEDLPVLAYGAE